LRRGQGCVLRRGRVKLLPIVHRSKRKSLALTSTSFGSRLASALTLAVVAVAVACLYGMVLTGKTVPLGEALHEARVVPAPPLLDAGEMVSAARLDRAFGRLGYHLDAVANGEAEVPPVFLAAVPGDLDELPDIDTKKAVFLRVVLPLVLLVDQEIAEDRSRLLDLAQRRRLNQGIAAADQEWLDRLAERYEVDDAEPRKLLRRVDVVPPSLALAQAAEESGWGTSPLARRSRNMFGHTINGEAAEASPAMRNFGSLYLAVRAYVHNLNTHKAYDALRRARATARARGTTPDGHTLAAALDSYSERGPAYVDTIRSLIRKNQLVRYDHARLGHGLAGRIASN
jgi:Bax protein